MHSTWVDGGASQLLPEGDGDGVLVFLQQKLQHWLHRVLLQLPHLHQTVRDVTADCREVLPFHV